MVHRVRIGNRARADPCLHPAVCRLDTLDGPGQFSTSGDSSDCVTHSSPRTGSPPPRIIPFCKAPGSGNHAGGGYGLRAQVSPEHIEPERCASASARRTAILRPGPDGRPLGFTLRSRQRVPVGKCRRRTCNEASPSGETQCTRPGDVRAFSVAKVHIIHGSLTRPP